MDVTTWSENNDDPNDQPLQHETDNVNNSGSTINETLVSALNVRELDFLERERNKLRLFDPQSVYRFRHIKLGILQSCVHFLSLVVSIICLICVWYYSQSDEVNIPGVGLVSNTTLMDDLYKYSLLLIVVSGIVALNKQLKQTPLRLYLLAMLANSINRAVLNLFKLLVLSLAGFSIFVLASEISLSEAIAFLDNGVSADVLLAVSYFLDLLIVGFAFRFCHKELEL